MKPITGPALLLSLALTALAGQAGAEPSAEDLAKLAQNPVGNLISVPFQNNTNFDLGPQQGTQNILNIQPVIPVSVNSDWNVITRTIVPLISMPALAPGSSRENGLGDTVFTAFLSPANPGHWIWGAGPVLQLPTHTNGLGNKNWGMGASLVVLRMAHGNPWVFGALVNNVWSLTSNKTGGSFNNGLIQPFLNYNFAGGLYLTSAPVVTANWEAEGGQKWTLPLGGGVGKIFHFGRLPVNAQFSAYYNVVHPDIGPRWQLRAQVQFMFPK